jgi:hypothetical protein
LIGTTLSKFYTYWATNTFTLTITIYMHASIFGMHVVETNFELHKLNMIFATSVFHSFWCFTNQGFKLENVVS